MADKKIRTISLAAMFAALCCVATLVIQIPSPMNGYVNLGDCFVLLGAVYLGPVWGFLAGGVGSMFADIISGYAHYAPGTFLIKGLMALAFVLIYRTLGKKIPDIASYLIAAVVGEVIMVTGYFGYASLILGKGLAAAASIPGNLMQGVFGVVSSLILVKVLSRVMLKR